MGNGYQQSYQPDTTAATGSQVDVGDPAYDQARGNAAAIDSMTGSAAGGSDILQTASGGNRTPATYMKSIEQVLKGSSTGAEALQYVQKNKIGLLIRSGQSVEMRADVSSGRVQILLNLDHPPQEAAAYFVHEVNHVREFQAGTSMVPETAPGEETYVDHMVREEANGTALAIRALIETDSTQLKVPRTTLPGEWQYRNAYSMTIEAGQSPDEAHDVAAEHLFTIYRYTMDAPPGKHHPKTMKQFLNYGQYYRWEYNDTLSKKAASSP